VQSLQPNTIAFQRFLKSGPLAVLPLWGPYSSIVWSLPSHICDELQNSTEEHFISELNKALKSPSDAPALGALPDRLLPKLVKHNNFETPPLIKSLKTKRYTFPLVLSHADQLASHRMALLGDSAHRVHPMAGQGLNLGLTDVAYLSNCILKSKREGQDIGSYDFTLADYDKKSKYNSYAMIAAIEFVK
jgi:ubiquinone biosynthesis monooxygenase Coq6